MPEVKRHFIQMSPDPEAMGWCVVDSDDYDKLATELKGFKEERAYYLADNARLTAEMDEWKNQHSLKVYALIDVETERDALRTELDAETKLHLEHEAQHAALVIGLKDRIDALRAQVARLWQLLDQVARLWQLLDEVDTLAVNNVTGCGTCTTIVNTIAYADLAALAEPPK